MSFRFADHRLLHRKLLGMAEETNDSYVKMTARLAALAIKNLADEVDSLRDRGPKRDATMRALSSHVYRAGEILYTYDLLDGNHCRFDYLHHASEILLALPDDPNK